MKKLWDWLTNHIVITLIICSVVFALIVHCLYSMPAPSEWWKHKWGAGDILTYVSTVTLGLLAVWQNQRFKEENDKAQERLEKISLKANELNLISKIVENESQYIAMLDDTFNELFDLCGVDNLSILMSGPFDGNKLMDNMKKIVRFSSKFKQAMMSGYRLQGYDVIPLYSKCAKVFGTASSILVEYGETRSKNRDKLNEMVALCSEAENEKDVYICLRRNVLQTILYEGLSISEIRNLYTKPEEIEYGKNENGVN